MNIDIKNISAGTIARTAVLILALINQILSATGHTVLPIASEELESVVTTLFTAGAALVAWWKDNDITAQAIARKAAGEEAMSDDDQGDEEAQG